MTRPTQHPASNSEARKRHDAPRCLVCGNSVAVDASALAAAKAEAWEVAHQQICGRGDLCSAHQPIYRLGDPR